MLTDDIKNSGLSLEKQIEAFCHINWLSLSDLIDGASENKVDKEARVYYAGVRHMVMQIYEFVFDKMLPDEDMEKLNKLYRK